MSQSLGLYRFNEKFFQCLPNQTINVLKDWKILVGNYPTKVSNRCIKVMFSKKATKIDEIFTIDLTLCSKCQIIGDDFVNFCCLLRKYELYLEFPVLNQVVEFVPMFLDGQTFDSHLAKCHIPLRSFSQWPGFCVYSQSH